MEKGASLASGKGGEKLPPGFSLLQKRKHGDFIPELRHIPRGEHISENTKFKMYVTEHGQIKVLVLEMEVTGTFLAIIT